MSTIQRSGLVRFPYVARWALSLLLAPLLLIACAPSQAMPISAPVSQPTATIGTASAPLVGHTLVAGKSISSLAWSPDGRTLAAALELDRAIQLWDPTTGLTIAALRGHTEGVWALAWSPDGRTLATAASGGSLRLWDPASGKARSLLDHAIVDERGRKTSYGVLEVAWSPDGRTIATAHLGEIWLWDPTNGKTITKLLGHTKPVYAVTWSPDGRALASRSGDGTIRLWDPKAR